MCMRWFNTLLLVVIFILAFAGGMWWQKQKYLDICLDLGGGMNPGNYPICVIERNNFTSKQNLEDGVYYCDEVGNRFVSENEARKHGLKDSEFGATFCLDYLGKLDYE